MFIPFGLYNGFFGLILYELGDDFCFEVLEILTEGGGDRGFGLIEYL